MNRTESLIQSMAFEINAADNTLSLRGGKRPEVKNQKQRRKEAAKKAEKKPAKEKATKPSKQHFKEVKPSKKSKTSLFVKKEKSGPLGRPRKPKKGSVLNTDRPKDVPERVATRESFAKLSEQIRDLSEYDNINVSHINMLGSIANRLKNMAIQYKRARGKNDG